MIHKAGIDSCDLVKVLNDYFPGLVFIPPKNTNPGVAKYIISDNGKLSLDIKAMSKSADKTLSSLFPENISRWNETEARMKFGCADVFRFFLDLENKLFSKGFFKLNNEAKGQSIPGRFLKELDYSGKPVWEDWDFSALVVHRMRRRPPGIYEAFCYYARRYYTLINLAQVPADSGDDEMIKSGSANLNNAVREKLPVANNLNIERMTDFFEMLQETLESVPSGGSLHSSTGMDVLINQLESRISGLYKPTGDRSGEETFSASDRKTINNHLKKAEKNISDREKLSELRKVTLTGTYREKINLLYSFVFSQASLKYSLRERNIINGLFLKQNKTYSLDMQFGSNDDDKFSMYDLVSDSKFTNPEDHLVWSSFFSDEFANELDRESLEKFISCLPDHFSRYPFDSNSEGDFVISKYSRKILFSTFCSVAGIPESGELWKPFLVLIQRVMDNINKSIKE